VKNNFLRLTPDRASKRGTAWAKSAIGNNWGADSANDEEISATMTFRISGQGAKLFGDGIGLWLTQLSRQTAGELHGITSDFVGLGIVIDTFKNVEHGSKHRDITVMLNDGTIPYKIGDNDDPIGCNVAGLRFHEERDDFSVFNTSRLRILLNRDRLILEVDAGSKNEWTTCVTVNDLDKKLPKNWLRKARFGISGTTGQLADNHDILSLQVHDSHSEGKIAAVRQHVLLNEGSDEITKVVHDLEHQLTSIVEKLENTISKLQKQEAAVEQRVIDLEKTMKETLGKEFMQKMEARITNLERKLDRKMQNTINSKIEKDFAGLDTGGWKKPFIFLIIMLAILGGLGYKKYRYLIKSHLL